MSLYRQVRGSRARTAILAGAIGLVVGALAGAVISGSGGDSSVRAEVERLQAEVRPALSALELVPIEYREAIRGGRVTAGTEYEASRAQASRAREVLEQAKGDLRALGAGDAAAAEDGVDLLSRLLAQKASPAKVGRAAAAAAAALRQAVGLEDRDRGG